MTEIKTKNTHLNPCFDFKTSSEDEAKLIFKEYNLSINYSEALKIQELLGREPTLSECILWGIQGSEHCSYKSSRVHLKTFITDGPEVILGAKEDAGVIRICRDNNGDGYGLVISHESHNHPSQVVPFEGAATGIGGNIRDVTCMGAEVIALADGLRFGDFNNAKTQWIYNGVVAGLASYGNAIGVPNITGDAYFHNGFKDNCLVTVTTLGALKEDEIVHSYAPPKQSDRTADKYALILVGKPTDNSGFGGASFASFDLDEADAEANKGAVQEPNAFLGRMMMKISCALFKKLKDKNLLDSVGFKDLGAGGIACASVEIAEASGYGANIWLDKVPVGMENLSPAVVLCAETQERYMWCCPPDLVDFILDHYNKEFDLPNISKGARAEVVGEIRADGQYQVRYKDQLLVDAKASDITEGIVYNRPYEILKAKDRTDSRELEIHLKKLEEFRATVRDKDFNKELLDLLSDPNLASKKPIYQFYDKQVQGRMVLTREEADAGVLLPFNKDNYPQEVQDQAVALGIASNPYYGEIDANIAGISAVVEAIQKITSVGAEVQAITDCLCFGNPEKPEQMGDFVSCVNGIKEACNKLGDNNHPVPIVAGNVSLYNESKNGAIPASPMISAVGSVKKDQVIRPDFNSANQVVIMVGDRQRSLGGSLWYAKNNIKDFNLINYDLDKLKSMNKAILDLVSDDNNLSVIKSIKAMKSINLGGVASCLALMCFKNNIGLDLKLGPQCSDGFAIDEWLFGEAPGFILAIDADTVERVFHKLQAYGVEHWVLGNTISEPVLKIHNIAADIEWLNINIQDAKSIWESGYGSK